MSDIFELLRELDLSIFDYLELPCFIPESQKIMFLVLDKALAKKRRRRH